MTLKQLLAGRAIARTSLPYQGFVGRLHDAKGLEHTFT